MPIIARVCGLVAALFCAAPAAMAQGAFVAMHDNDEWAGTDWEYAQGTRFALTKRKWGRYDWVQDAARLLPGIEPGEGLSGGLGLSHVFYTPRSLAATRALPNQRAYGAEFNLSGLLIGETDRRLDMWKLDVGVVGPSAEAEELVDFFHNVFNGLHMNGWDNQIRDRLALNASWERRWRNLHDLGGGLQLDLSPAVGVEAGTVSTAAGAGLTLRIGAALDGDFGSPRVGALGGSLGRHGRKGWSAYAFASADARYVAYDVFLDEAGGRDSDPVRGGSAISRDDVRTQTSYGLVLAHGGTRLTFAMTETPRLYDQQIDERHRVGELTFGWGF